MSLERVREMLQIHLFPALRAFWFLEKTALRENRVSATVLMIQLTRNSPTCAYIGKNMHKWKLRQWKPRYAGLGVWVSYLIHKENKKMES